jgi:nucleoside-diphosphate-sugar epimerase
MRVMVTGGCGYKGSVLVPKLLKEGYEVLVVDNQWFGNYLPIHPQLKVLKMDTREDVPLDGVDAIVHLAAIANDPCGELDARLTWDVNVLATWKLAQRAERAGVDHFIFASSASIYGIKGNEPVREDTTFEPVSDYNKTKMVAETMLWSLSNGMGMTFLRPATVCGVSPRMRLDVIVNMLTAQALEEGAITAHCGPHGAKLMRPHMHIEDVTDLYLWALREKPYGAINAASDNQEVGETAKIIAQQLPCKVSISETVDKRSYAVDYSKLLGMGFKPRRVVRDAVNDIAVAWVDGRLKRHPNMINLKWMRYHGWAT